MACKDSPAGMIFIESLLAFMAVLFTSKECGHAGDDSVMIVMIIQVKVFFGFETREDKGFKCSSS